MNAPRKLCKFSMCSLKFSNISGSKHNERQAACQVARSHWNALWCSKNWSQTHSLASCGASQWIHRLALHDS